MSLREQVIERFRKRRQNLIDGNVNSIPSPFQRFSDDFIGLEQGTYYLFSSYTKGGKSQLVNYLLFKAILFAYYTKSDVSVKILYFNIEETREKIMARFMSWLLFKWTEGKYRCSIRDLMSSKNERPLSLDVLEILENDEFSDIVDYFEKCIIFSDEENPTGIYKTCKNYLRENGVITTKPAVYRDEFGKLQQTQSFDKYIPNNPNEYVFAVVDTINIISLERNFTKKQAIDKLSEYFIELRNDYNLSPIVIQQQNTDGESADNVKLGRTRPSPSGLGDSKYTAHDANIMLGIFSPFKFGLKEYLGYPIDKFKDHFRTLEVCINRDGEIGGIIPLLFDGAVCDWSELPRLEDTAGMNKVYQYIRDINNHMHGKVFFTFMKTIKKFVKNNWKWKINFNFAEK